MQEFIERHLNAILRTRSGFDRDLFRGSADAIGSMHKMDLKLRELGCGIQVVRIHWSPMIGRSP